MKNINKRHKIIPKLTKEKTSLLRYDDEFSEMMNELKDLLGLENNSQLLRYSVKHLYRHKILNLKQLEKK